jgi:hypothetical protein
MLSPFYTILINIHRMRNVQDRWMAFNADMCTPRSALGACFLDGYVYAVGGNDGSQYLKSAERFDSNVHHWIQVGSMNTARQYFGIGKGLFSIGLRVVCVVVGVGVDVCLCLTSFPRFSRIIYYPPSTYYESI